MGHVSKGTCPAEEESIDVLILHLNQSPVPWPAALVLPMEHERFGRLIDSSGDHLTHGCTIALDLELLLYHSDLSRAFVPGGFRLNGE